MKNSIVTETATTINIPTPDGPGDSYQTNGDMTVPDESPTREVRSLTRSFLGPKNTIHLGIWNVRSMTEAITTAQVLKEMQRYHLEILGISECRWTGTGRYQASNGTVILYSSKEASHISGTALIISKNSVKSLIEWEPISDRFIRARFDSKYCKLSVIQCYSPTNDEEDEVKDGFFNQLQQIVAQIPPHDMLLIMGDLNAKVGNDNTDTRKQKERTAVAG